MPRKHLLKSPVLPYHVTARANNRENFPLDKAQLWKIIGNECLLLHLLYGVEFQSFVLMANHFHTIVTVPEYDLGIVMNHFMKSISRTVNLFSGRSGHVFGGPYHWSLINSTRYFSHAMKYVYRNPVRAKICENVEDYPYSTVQGLLGLAPLPFPLNYTRVGMEISFPSDEGPQQLEWLNTPFPKEAEALIRKGLHHRIFQDIIDPATRRPSELFMGLI
jgi:putative transposase